jgi:hypothetical protein
MRAKKALPASIHKYGRTADGRCCPTSFLRQGFRVNAVIVGVRRRITFTAAKVAAKGLVHKQVVTTTAILASW